MKTAITVAKRAQNSNLYSHHFVIWNPEMVAREKNFY